MSQEQVRPGAVVRVLPFSHVPSTALTVINRRSIRLRKTLQELEDAMTMCQEHFERMMDMMCELRTSICTTVSLIERYTYNDDVV